MPLLKPSTPPKKSTKPAGKTLPPKKGEAPHGKGKSSHQPPPPAPRPPALSFWDHLSAERKLDVVGILLAFIGVVIILGLVSPTHSEPIKKIFSIISQIFGWGIYILPLGMLIFGLWLVFRKIERIPRFPLNVLSAASSYSFGC
ncbi:hypothetical protein [Candidatus Villigracilis affinis]|uniref:hypothetical protein n=1 Tax=Candidatus Villigracilis affinis TaxID=3140682 RepID=UPI002A19B813|nr:hypothetical protein [Anaerolineales bacterium]